MSILAEFLDNHRERIERLEQSLKDAAGTVDYMHRRIVDLERAVAKLEKAGE